MSEKNPNLTPGERLEVDKAHKDAQPFALQQFFRDSVAPSKESHIKGIDTLFNNLKLGAKDYVENYASVADQAITAMKKYTLQVYADLEEEIQHLSRPEDRAEWAVKLRETQKKASNYQLTIAAFLRDFERQNAEDGKAGIGMNELWKIAERANEIFREMYRDPKYGEIIIMASANELSADTEKAKSAFEFIYSKIQRRDISKGDNLTVEDSVKLLEQAGVAAILQAMDFGERLKFTEYIIQENKPDALLVIKSLVGSNFMSIIQGEELIGKMIAKNPSLASQRESIIAEMTTRQEKTTGVQEGIERRLQRKQYRNQVHRATEPKFMIGLFLTTWRGTNGLATIFANRMNLKELAGSPYFYLDVMGVAGGLALMSNGEVFKFLKTMTDGERDQKELMRRGVILMETANRYPAISRQYFEKGGTVEIIDTLRVERAKQKKTGPLTIEEIIAEADKEYVTNKNPGLKGSLQKIQNTEQRRQFLVLAQQIYELGNVKNTDTYNAYVKSARAAQHVTPTV